MLQCPTCGVYMVQDSSSAEEQDRQFHQDLDESLYVEYFEPFRKGQYREVLGRLNLEPGSSLLDVGASYGWMVDVGLELGLDSHGIEPSPMEYDAPLAGRILCRTLEEHAAQTDRRYDVITLWHVLEHLRDPVTAARHIGDVAADDGLVVIAVPNAEGHMYRLASRLLRRLRYGRLMEELWYTHNPNMHRTYPTARSLAHTLGHAQLRVVDIYTLDAFDWRRIWRRSTNAVGRTVLRVGGPVLHRSRFTAKENLIVVATKAAAQ